MLLHFRINKMYRIKSYKCRWFRIFKNGGEVFNLDDVVPSYGVSSREILKTLNIANEELKLNIHFMSL